MKNFCFLATPFLTRKLIIYILVIYIVSVCAIITASKDPRVTDFSYPTDDELDRAVLVKASPSWGFYMRREKSVRIYALGTTSASSVYIPGLTLVIFIVLFIFFV